MCTINQKMAKICMELSASHNILSGVEATGRGLNFVAMCSTVGENNLTKPYCKNLRS
jgi:hypothetical protein